MVDTGIFRRESSGPGPARTGHVVAAAIRRRPVVAFFVLAYAWSWTWWWAIAADGGIVRRGVWWPSHMPGLLGPAIAAFAVTAVVDGRAGVAGLAARIVRVRIGVRATAVALSPLAMLAAGVLVTRVVDGHWPVWADLTRISGLPATVVLMLVGLLLLNGLGEETGWRGFAQQRLQQRHGQDRAALLVAVGWSLWHLPLFVVVDSFRGFAVAALPGFLISMAAGAIVLAHCYNLAGSSIAAAAVWHTGYNLATGSSAATGAIQAVATTAVIVWAAALVIAHRRKTARLAVPRPGRDRRRDESRPRPTT